MEQNNLYEITAKMLEQRCGYHNAKKETVHKNEAREIKVRWIVANLVLNDHIFLG